LSNKNIIPAHLALFGANLIYGLNYILAKDVMPNFVGPSGFIFLRVGGALLLFWLFASLFRTGEKVDKKDFPRLIICALFGVAGNQLLFFEGLNITTPINASIIMVSNPILVLIMASIILKNAIKPKKVLGIGLGITGAVLLILFRSRGGELTFSSETAFGDLLVFLNAACFGIYLVLVKPLMEKYKPITVVKWAFLFGFLFVIPFGFGQFTEINWGEMPTKIYLEILYVVVGTTFLAYLFNNFALKRVQPTVVSIYIYSQPLIASVFSLLLGKDEITWIKILSAILIFFGVYLVSRPDVRKT
jgi:drug/metabolite transporter (DMT)-like permease